MLVGPLDRSRLPQVILGPARKARLEFSAGLVERMVADTHGGDALPLLAYTLRELYDRERPDARVITDADYDAIGGVEGALRRRADLVHRELVDRGLGASVLPTLLRMVTVDAEGEPARRRVAWSALDAAGLDVVRAFVDARLLVVRQRGGEASAELAGAAGGGDDVVVEVAHEALVRQWPPLSNAIDEHRDELQIRSEIERGTQDWLASRCRPEYLFTGQRLDRAARLLSEPGAGGAGSGLSTDELQFLTVSERGRERAVVSARWRARNARARGAAVVGAFAVVCAFAVFQMVNATKQDRVAEAVTMAGAALSELTADSGDGAGLSLRAFDTSRTTLTESALRLAAGQTLPQETVRTGALDAMALSRDGHHLAGATADGGVRVWDLERPDTDPSVLADPQPTDPTRRLLASASASVVFDDDARRVAVVDGSGVAHIHDLRTRRNTKLRPADVRSLAVRSQHVDELSFVAGGRLLALANGAGVSVWDIATPDADPIFVNGGGGADRPVALAPDGRRIASIGDDGRARIWDWRARRRATILRGQPGDAIQVAIAADADYVATADQYGAIRVWDLHGADNRPRVLRGRTGSITMLAFMSDTRLAVSDNRGNVTLLDRQQPRVVAHGYLADTGLLAFGSRQVAAAANDDTVRVFEWHEPPARRIPGRGVAIAMSADGSRVATAAKDGAVRVWQGGAPGGPQTLLRSGIGPVVALAFAPDGDHLAAAASGDAPGEGGASVWEWRAPEVAPVVVQENIGAVDAVAFGDQGRQVAVATDQGLGVWNWHEPRGDFDFDRRNSRLLLESDRRATLTAFAHGGRFVAQAWPDGALSVSDVQEPTDASVASDAVGDISALAFSLDDRRLASGLEDGSVQVWDWRAQTQTTVLRGHLGAVSALTFAPDQHNLASAGTDGTVRIWDWRTPSAPPTILPGRPRGVSAMEFSADGRRLYSIDRDGTIQAMSCQRCGDIERIHRVVRERATYEP